MSESTTPQAALGELLDEARHEAGYSLRDLAKRACRVLNQALFTRLYADADDAGPRVSGDEPSEVFAPVINTHKAAKHNGGVAALSGKGTAVSDAASSSATLHYRRRPTRSPR
ncbi:hypothetical protein [Streptomyces sp. NBC_01320]|uniref:hypothetical protein n=1 Tax=Streptomyces sp. NBC_01320 TaxID=2903824 RepID=UPI002E11E939|nr:hypothetical protein OG395_07780 [Streptomyces sp. NBC_01320]